MSKSIKSFSEKILAIVLMIAMLLALFPASAFAKTSAKESQYNWSYSSSGSVDNMAVIEDGKIADGTPKNVDEANVKWAAQFQLNYYHSISQPTFMNGDLFLVAAQKLHKIDSATGEVLATSEESISNRYNYFLVNDGKYIYVQTETTVSAFDSNLKKVWESESFNGNQGLSKLYCEGEQIYGATVNTSGEASEIFCLKQADGTTVWSIDVAHQGGTEQKYTGIYWSGANVIGDYVVIGSEGGIVYSIDKAAGTIKDKLELGAEYSVRSAIANVESTLYFTANSSWSEGKVYKVELNADGSFGEAKASESIGNSIATPVVHNGRMYIGGGGNIYVMNAETLAVIYKIDCNKMKVQDICLLVSEDSDEVYGYATYYNKPGSVIGFSDKPGQTEEKYFDIGGVTESFGDGYCANQLVIGPDGTLYITNDDYALIAVEGNKAYLNSLSSNAGEWKAEFSPSLSSNELVVDRDIDSVEISFEASDGSKVIYEGKEATSGVTVDVGNTAKEINLLVQNGNKEREYTVSVRKAAIETGLAVAGGEYNNNADSINTIYRADGNLYVIEEVGEVKTFIGTIDENATVEWEIVKGEETEAREITSPYNEKDGQKYSHYVNWGSDYEGTTLAKATVTAEDGVTKQEHYIIVTSGDETTYKFAKKLSLSLKNKTVTVGEDGTKLQATVTEYIGKADAMSYDKTVWESSDEKVATVDSNGNVKALSNGEATITAKNGPAFDSCKVVVDMDTITAYVSIADSGKFVNGVSEEMVASLPVTVEDLNSDGKFSVDETLRAAHEEYYEGGADAGYKSEEGNYGLSITKLWGDASGFFGYWNDDVSCMSLEEEVKNGGHVKAFIYTDKVSWSDKYTCFEDEQYSIDEGQTIELKLLEAGYDSNWNTVFSGSKGAKIAVLSEGEKNVSAESRTADMVTDENGIAKVSFDKAGNYRVVAYKEDGSIVPSLCTVKVRGEGTSEDGGDSNNNSNTSNSGDNPKTGDDTNVMLWALIALAACMGGASMVRVERKQK